MADSEEGKAAAEQNNEEAPKPVKPLGISQKETIEARAKTNRMIKLLEKNNPNLAIVVKLCQEGVDVNTKEKIGGFTAMHHACFEGNVAVAEKLLEMKCNLELKNKMGRYPLHLAAENGRVKVIELLLKAGADITSTSPTGWNALHFAAQFDHLDTCKYLLENDVVSIRETHLETKDGQTAYTLTELDSVREMMEAFERKKFLKKKFKKATNAIKAVGAFAKMGGAGGAFGGGGGGAFGAPKKASPF